MTLALARRAGWVVLAAWCAWLGSAAAWAQAPSQSYEVRRGDTLFAIARKTKHDSVSRNQMILAIYRANQGAFPGGNIHLLAVGTALELPSREAAAAIDSAEADRQVGELIAKPIGTATVASVLPAPKPAPAKPAPDAVAPPVAGKVDPARRYREGLALEQRGDERAAFQAFLEAGEGGYGLAQKKLGEIYDKGNSAVERDYGLALQWYQKAREQGVPIPKPFVRSPR